MSDLDASHEYSAGFLEAFATAVKELGGWASLEASLDAEVLGALRMPRKQRWWPGGVVTRSIVVLDRAVGPEVVQQAGFLAVKRGLAPFAMRLVKVNFALFGVTPHAIYTRAMTFSAPALRGVKMSWTKETETSGTLVAEYTA